MALQSRPEPMNASPFHSKVKTTLKFADSQFVAGGYVAGKMEVECRADSELGLGIIMVELVAIEELTSRDHSATSTFLDCSRIFQGPGLPPSNAVHAHPLPGELQLPVGYFTARRGITTFLFRLPIPSTSPSAINFGSGLANVRYEVQASVGVYWKDEKRLITDKKGIDVVESSEGTQFAPDPQAVVIGEGGKMWIQGKIVGNHLVAGQPACVELYVKNYSTKKNTGLSVSLTRNLHLPNFSSAEKPPLQISDSLTSVSFRGPEYVIQPGVEGVANLVFDVPANARGVKGGRRQGNEDSKTTPCLFEVRCIIGVKMSMGFGSKDIQVDLPVTVLHPAALPEVPPSEPYPLPPIQPYYSEPQIPSTPAPYFSPYHHPYPLPPVSPVPNPHSPAPPFYPPQSPYMLPPPVDPNLYYLPPDPAIPPYYLPLRSSSVEPTPSHPLYQMPSGLPPVHQPLVPLMTGLLQDIGREEGKGERASRISQHLRISSRHRSVSPQAHRYHNPSLTGDHPSFVPQQPITVAAHHSYPLPSLQQQPGSPNLSVATNVISPRPMLSPKRSFVVDPVTHATLSKSDRVKTLERIAAQAVQDNCDMSNSVSPIVGLSAADKDKSLPAPPVPSQKPHTAPEELRPRVDTLFPPAPTLGEPAKETPRTPTIAAVTSLKVPRTVGDVKGGVSGLDALEARLLAEVGTRKVELDDKKPDVRSIMPIAIPRPIAAQEAPANDSAISSLTLPGVGADELSPRVEKAKSTHSGELHDGEITERGRRSYRGREDERVSNGAKGERRVEKKSGKRNKDRHGEHNDGEIQQLRKAAQGRITAWLGAIDPTARPQNSASPSPARSPDPPPMRPEEPPASFEPMVHPFQEKDIEEENTTITQPNPRSSGFVPIETFRLTNQRQTAGVNPQSPPLVGSGSEADQVTKLPRFPPRPVPGQRYDVRSARGGRGGQVTAVAAIWASATQTTSKDKGEPTPKLLPAKVRRPVKRPSKEQVAKDTAPNIPRRFPPIPKPKKVSSKEDITMTETIPATVAKLSSRRARMIKSTSVPAVVSSSLATPMLSSTASLARPPVPRAERTKLDAQVSQLADAMHSIPEGKTDPPAKPPEPKVELAFGQARLRELIKRYQGQSNA